MCISLRFYRVRKCPGPTWQNAHLPLWYFDCGHRRVFQCLMIHFKVPFCKCLCDCGNKPVYARTASLANRLLSPIALSLRFRVVFLQLREPFSSKCVCGCGAEAPVCSGFVLFGLPRWFGGQGPGASWTCRDFRHSIYCGFIVFHFCL